MVNEMHNQEKYIIWPWPQGQGGQGHTKCWPVPSTSCDLCTSKVWCCYIPWLRRRCIYKKVHYLTLTLGSRSHKILPSTLDIMWPMHQQSLILLHPTVEEKMHLQKYTLNDLNLQVKVTWKVAQCPLHHVTYAPTVWSYYVKSFRRRSIYKKIQYLTFDLDLGVKVTRNVAQYPLHHVTYPATKFEVATSNPLGGDTFTRKYIIWSLTLTLGSRSHKMLPSTLYIMWPILLQSLKLLCQKVNEEMHLQENSIFDLIPWPRGQGHTKCCPVPSTSCDLFSFKVWSCYV